MYTVIVSLLMTHSGLSEKNSSNSLVDHHFHHVFWWKCPCFGTGSDTSQIGEGLLAFPGTFLRFRQLASRFSQAPTGIIWEWQQGISETWIAVLPSGKHTKNDGKSPCLMGKTTISMAIFNSYVSLPEGIWLVVDLPLWKIYEFVRLDHHPNYWGK